MVESDNLVLVTFVVESLAVGSGHIRFVPRASTYHFEGRVTADQMSGTMSASPYYVDAGVQVRTSGSWRAVRVPSPQVGERKGSVREPLALEEITGRDNVNRIESHP